jgi:hypothetical protein
MILRQGTWSVAKSQKRAARTGRFEELLDAVFCHARNVIQFADGFSSVLALAKKVAVPLFR